MTDIDVKFHMFTNSFQSRSLKRVGNCIGLFKTNKEINK